MSIETLKQHTNRKIEELTEKKVALHGKLQERGVLNFGWSILPDIVETELELQDWNTVSRVIEYCENEESSTTGENIAKTIADRLLNLVNREKESHCEHVYIPNSSSQLSNVFELSQLSHKPKRWKAIESAIYMVEK